MNVYQSPSERTKPRVFAFDSLATSNVHSLNTAIAMPNVASAKEVLLRRPQPAGLEAPFRPPGNGTFYLAQQQQQQRASPCSSSSSLQPTPSSSTSSFCDDQNSATPTKRRPNTRPPSTYSLDAETEILENWLEVQFQVQFKRLNGLIRSANGSSKSSLHQPVSAEEDDSEILFLKAKHTQADGRTARPTTGLSSCNSQTVISPTQPHSPSQDSTAHQLTSWLMSRGPSNSGGHFQQPQLRSQTIHEEVPLETPFVQLRPKSISPAIGTPQDSPSDDWIDHRLSNIESLLSANNVASSTVPIVSQNLLFLALTEPNDKANRDTLLYSFPPPPHSDSSKNSVPVPFSPSVIKLGGMFITLSEILDLVQLSSSTSSSRTSQYLTVRLQVTPGANSSSKVSPATLPTRAYLFTILRFQYSHESVLSLMDSRFAKSKKPPTVYLLVGLNAEVGFTESDSVCLSYLLEKSIKSRFGTIQNAFEAYFRLSSGNTTPTTLFLNRTLSLFDCMISPAGTEKSSLEVILSLTNTFFSTVPGALSSGYLRLPLRHLPSDDSVTMLSCKLLNYFDSLDWLDEAIARFYRKDSMDLEGALSEHLSRCLQWEPPTTTQTNRPPPPTTKKVNASELSTSFMNGTEETNNNGHPAGLFDLLELELSSFVVIGSAMFYRGLLVQSNVPADGLNAIWCQLFSRGLLPLSKHREYDLVYFTRLEELNSKRQTEIPSESTIFLQVLGQGHLLHCSLLQVYRFDRGSTMTDSFASNGTAGPYHSTTTPTVSSSSSSVSLPSSFAFYVFIKESFRFLTFNLNCIANNRLFGDSAIETHLEESLENVYRLGNQIANDNFSLMRSANKKATKAMKKMKEKEDKSQRKREKDESKRKSVGILRETDEHFLASHKTPLPHSHSVPTTPSKPSSSRPASLYSNWSYSSATSAHSLSSATESDCGCSESESSHLDLRSLQSSVTSQSTSIASSPLPTADLLSGSIYRFTNRSLPESLVLYLNVEPSLQLESFYGPILGFAATQSLDQPSFNRDLPNQPEIVCSIVGILVREIQNLRQRLGKLSQLESKRRQGKAALSGSAPYEPVTSGQILTLHYDLITSKRIAEQDLAPQALVISFTFYLLGRCTAGSTARHENDEFYACFKLNRKTNEAIGELTNRGGSGRGSKWSFGRFSLKLDTSKENEADKRRSGSFLDRSTEYEVHRLDILKGEFEELIQSVRLGGADWH